MIFQSLFRILNAKWLLLLMFFVVICQSLYGQSNKQEDSLKNLLRFAKEDSNKVNILNNLAFRHRGRRRAAEGYIYANEALKLAEKINFRHGMGMALTHRAWITGARGEWDQCYKDLDNALRIFNELGEPEHIAGTYTIMGVNYQARSLYAESIKYHTLSLKIKQQICSEAGIIDSYNSLGSVYKDMGNYPEALRHYLSALKIRENDDAHPQNTFSLGILYQTMGNHSEALDHLQSAKRLFEEQGNKEGIANALTTIGNVLSEQGNNKEALENYLAALKIFKELVRKVEMAYTYLNMGLVHANQSNFSEALNNYLEALRIFEELRRKNGIAGCYIEIGKMFIKTKRNAEAKKHLMNALSISKEIGTKAITKSSYEGLSKVDSAMGNYQQAFEHYKLYHIYKDSLLNEISSQQMQQMKEEFESEKKDKELIVLSNEKAIQTLQLKKQRQTMGFLIAGLLLFAILSFFIYRTYRTRQKLKLQTLRNKIASDLHDDVGSTLSSISIFSQMAMEGSKEVKPLLQTIGESSRKMLDAMADIVWTINPENDQFEKIVMRMRSFAYELLGAKQIEFRFVADNNISNIKLPMEARRNLYLIFKEATNNMVKYANASKAMFSIKEEQGRLVMMIKDDGKGFESNKETQGNGLKNMKKRATEIGGELTIDSQPGNGTTIQLSVAV